MSQDSTRASMRGRVGPNAIIRVVAALEDAQGRAAVERLLIAAGLERYLDALPTEMVDEQEVTRLQSALREQVGIE